VGNGGVSTAEPGAGLLGAKAVAVEPNDIPPNEVGATGDAGAPGKPGPDDVRLSPAKAVFSGGRSVGGISTFGAAGLSEPSSTPGGIDVSEVRFNET
jgi:hypothetical protein